MHLTREKWFEIFKYVPQLAADCVVLNNKREVLLIQRGHEPWKGFWALPGGFVEKGETVESAAARECFEESGIKVKTLELLGVYSNPKRDPRGHVISIAFLCKPLNSRTRKSSETTDAGFFQPKKMPGKLTADHRKIIKDALSALESRRTKNIYKSITKG